LFINWVLKALSETSIKLKFLKFVVAFGQKPISGFFGWILITYKALMGIGAWRGEMDEGMAMHTNRPP
jgi:hypothetical protein